MKRVLWVAVLAVAPMLNGCATNESGPSLGNLGRNFADDWTGARSYDQATIDWGRGNLKSVQEAGEKLDKRITGGSRTSLNIAESWMIARISEALLLSNQAGQTTSDSERDETRRDADKAYRAALAFLPSDPNKWPSLNPWVLNGVGYFLADRGKDKREFEMATRLTKIAFDLSPSRNSVERYFRAAGPGDSYAWALFRAGRTAEALQQQSKVIATLGDDGGPNNPPSADVIYHWGAICRVAGRENSARDAFTYALTQNPTVELREILEANLSGELV